MDVVRKRSKSRKWLRWLLVLLVVGGGIAGATAALSSLKKALPEFSGTSVVVDEVQFGTMVRTVRGPGTLVPRDITLVTADVGGAVVEVLVEPGDTVEKDVVLLKLKDPLMERAIRDATRSVNAARASVKQFELQQKSNSLSRKLSTERARASFEDAKEDAELNERLARRGLVARRQWEALRDKAERQRLVYEVEIESQKNSLESLDSQMAVKLDAIKQAEDWLAEKKEQEKQLTITAPASGVVQQLGAGGGGLEVGQRVSQGVTVARITSPGRLMAELQISQTQALDIVVGQPTEIDTRNGIIEGRVSRIDPGVLNDRVTVDVELIGELPKGARPDLSVEGLIEVSRLKDVTFVRKPAFARPNARAKLYRMEADGETAVQVSVEYGSSSAYTIEVVNGLKPGDKVVVSDPGRWRSHERVRLK